MLNRIIKEKSVSVLNVRYYCALMGPKIAFVYKCEQINIFLINVLKGKLLLLWTRWQMLSLRDRYVKISMTNADIRKLVHGLDDEDNYDTVKRKSVTHTDFSTNFLKTLFGTFLGCLFYYLQWLSWSLEIPCWCNSLAIWHGVKTLENVPCIMQRSRTAMSIIVDFLSSMVLDSRKQRNYMASIAVAVYIQELR